MEATLRLFKALPIDTRKPNLPLDPSLAQHTIGNGFIFAPAVSARYTTTTLLDWVNQLYGRNPEELNATFHKSFATVRDTPLEALVFQQVMHYLTTYGAKAFGVYNEAAVYIPAEQLDAPALNADANGLRFVVIRGLTPEELKQELMQLLASGVALADQTVKDAVAVAKYVGNLFTADDLGAVRNKEVRAALYDHLGIVPADPEEFLRYIVHKATDSTLLIKSPGLLAALKGRDNTDLEPYFAKANYADLGAVFYRYKPIFLALRTTPTLKAAINRIRRAAPANHKPLRQDTLNTLTARLDTVTVSELAAALEGATIFRKIRLAYALKFRTGKPESVVYRIRNGKSWATEFTGKHAGAEAAYALVRESIVNDLRPAVYGKTVFIPVGLRYALPATEKQFTGNFPTGTYAEVTDNLVAGVHWRNLDGPRGGKGTQSIDLDLSITNAEGKIGWDGRYRHHQQAIYFSGDIVDAPNGATEVFHVGAQARGCWLMHLNFFNYTEGVEVPYKIVVGRDEQRNINHNYTIDPNKIVALANATIPVKQKTLGIIVADDNYTRFYFAEMASQRTRTARHNTAAEHARSYLLNYYTNSIVLNDLLADAGAILVPDLNEPVDIDLSWEAIDRTTILDMLTPTPELVGAKA